VTLQASYVPPEDFEGKQWFEPMRPGARWFYHRPREESAPIDYAVLSQSIDEDLRPIASRLVAQGLTTGASCAGHEVRPERVKAAFLGLLEDEIIVCSIGLPVRDVETGKQFLWQDTDYRLGWDCGNDFLADAWSGRLKGYLPVYGSREQLHILSAALTAIPHLSVELLMNRCIVRVHAPNQGLQRFAWLEGAKALGW